MGGRIYYIEGEKIGNATFLRFEGKIRNKVAGLFICQCGKSFVAVIAGVKSGNTRSCGCIHSAQLSNRNRKHGLAFSPLYKVWGNMKTRCYNANCNSYKDYGGRGIIICDGWKNDFLTFAKWALLNGWNANLEIDRINNNGNYEPNNCRFVTVTEWEKHLGFPAGVLHKRLYRKWNIERSLNQAAR
jgi:hypothetical protein